MSVIEVTMGAVGTMMEPTPQLRWLRVSGFDPVLQQMWRIGKQDRNGYMIYEAEWREVPSEIGSRPGKN